MGSPSLGLANYLIKKGHRVTVVTPTDYPVFLAWMKGNEEVLDFSNPKDQKIATEKLAEADVIFCLDFSVLSRVNELGELIRKSKAFVVNIDHHQDPEDFAQYRYWSTHIVTGGIIGNHVSIRGSCYPVMRLDGPVSRLGQLQYGVQHK